MLLKTVHELIDVPCTVLLFFLKKKKKLCHQHKQQFIMPISENKDKKKKTCFSSWQDMLIMLGACLVLWSSIIPCLYALLNNTEKLNATLADKQEILKCNMLTPCQSFSADSPEHALEPESSSAASEVVLQNKTLLWKLDMRPPFNQKNRILNRKSHLFAMQTS